MSYEMTRKDLIEELITINMEGMDASDFRELLKGSWKGYNNTSDKELIKEYWDILGECLEEDGYTGVTIIEETN